MPFGVCYGGIALGMLGIARRTGNDSVGFGALGKRRIQGCTVHHTSDHEIFHAEGPKIGPIARDANDGI